MITKYPESKPLYLHNRVSVLSYTETYEYSYEFMSIPTMTKTDKRNFYKSLVTMNFTEAAANIGLDRKYQNTNTLRNYGYQIYKSIDPMELDIDRDVVEMVESAIEKRRAGGSTDIIEHHPEELINPNDTKEVVIGGANKAAMLLHKKMDRMNKSKKLLDAVSLSQLSTTFGILFDKSRIVQGEATEHIAYMGRIKSDMTPEETLDALIGMRENTVNENNPDK